MDRPTIRLEVPNRSHAGGETVKFLRGDFHGGTRLIVKAWSLKGHLPPALWEEEGIDVKEELGHLQAL